MKNIFKIFSFAILALMFSCETTDLELRDNPTQLGADDADVEFLYNSIQTQFGSFVNAMGSFSAELVRIEQMAGRDYLSTYTPEGFSTTWNRAYSVMFNDLNTMQPLAEEAGQLQHLGKAQIMQAYTLIALVDAWGDVPFSEILQPVNFPNPNADNGAAVYAAAMDLLDQGIANVSNDASASGPETDLIYPTGDPELWVRAANSIKLKALLQTRLVDGGAVAAFNSIINTGNYIQSTDQDFQFNWGDLAIGDGISAHPFYLNDYTPTGAGAYRSNYLMDYMQGDNKADQGDDDPRMRYFFFRQRGCTPGSDIPGCATNQQVLPCSIQNVPPHYTDEDIFCNPAFGYWGRDHGNADGIPPDGFDRTAYGVYPAAGRIDADYFDRNSSLRRVGSNQGGGGQGITPIILASNIDFYRAEIALFVNGNSSDALTFISNGISKNVAKVQSFASLDATASQEDFDFVDANTQSTADFISQVSSDFNGGNDNAKRNVLANQFFVSLYGNGVDGYAFYRRTGFPTTLQPNLEINPGGFMRSFLYPASEANTNANITQKPTVTQQVFWDNNPSSPGFPVAN